MCASPGVVLAPRGMLDGLACTAHPAFVKDLPSDASANGRVVVDGDVVTSRGPGTALEFALALAEKLFGADKAREVAAPMVLPPIDHSTSARGERVAFTRRRRRVIRARLRAPSSRDF